MIHRVFWVVAVTLVMTGCGGSASGPIKPPDDRAHLEGVGEAYRLFCLSKKPPVTFTDLCVNMTAVPAGLSEVKSSRIIVQYGAMMPDLETEGPSSTPSDEVVAYMADVPTSGGQVLMLNRTVKKMTADEFKAAKKAGTK